MQVSDRSFRSLLPTIIAVCGFLHLPAPSPADERDDAAGLVSPKDDLLEALRQQKPDIVLVGNSMQGQGIDFGLMSRKLGMKVFNAECGGAMSVWQYGVLRYVLSQMETKPRIVIVIERWNHFTSPQIRAEYLPRTRQMAAGQDLALVERLAAYGEGQPRHTPEEQNRLDGFFWDFPKAARWSFLPHMIHEAREGGYQLIIARHRNRRMAENPDWYPPEMQKYREDMAWYLQANGVPFLDYDRCEKIGKDLYANGDHLNPEGRQVWTDLMIEDIKAVLAGRTAPYQYLPPEGYKPPDELVELAKAVPVLPDPPPPEIAAAMAAARKQAAARAERRTEASAPAPRAEAPAAPPVPGARPTKGLLSANQESIIYFGRGMRSQGIIVATVMLPSPHTSLSWIAGPAGQQSKVSLGVVPLDVTKAFDTPNRAELYRSPTTLSPKGVEVVAEAIAEEIREEFPFLDAPLAEYESVPATVWLNVTIQQVRQRGAKEFLRRTHQTRLVLVGDRNVGVYSDPALGLGQHAGLGEHLSKALGRPIQWHWRDAHPSAAIGELMKDVNLDQASVIVWVMMADDLLAPAWGRLPVPAVRQHKPQPDRLVVRARIVKPSPAPEPDLLEKYPDTVNYTLWEIQEVVEGEWDDKELLTVEWSQKDLDFLRPFRYEIGQTFALTLIPLADAHRRDRFIRRADFVDDVRRNDLPPFWIIQHGEP